MKDEYVIGVIIAAITALPYHNEMHSKLASHSITLISNSMSGRLFPCKTWCSTASWTTSTQCSLIIKVIICRQNWKDVWMKNFGVLDSKDAMLGLSRIPVDVDVGPRCFIDASSSESPVITMFYGIDILRDRWMCCHIRCQIYHWCFCLHVENDMVQLRLWYRQVITSIVLCRA